MISSIPRPQNHFRLKNVQLFGRVKKLEIFPPDLILGYRDLFKTSFSPPYWPLGGIKIERFALRIFRWGCRKVKSYGSRWSISYSLNEKSSGQTIRFWDPEGVNMGVIKDDFINPETPKSFPAQKCPTFWSGQKVGNIPAGLDFGVSGVLPTVSNTPIFTPWGSQNRTVCPEDFSLRLWKSQVIWVKMVDPLQNQGINFRANHSILRPVG